MSAVNIFFLTPPSMHIHMKNNIRKHNIGIYFEYATFMLLRGRGVRFTKLAEAH